MFSFLCEIAFMELNNKKIIILVVIFTVSKNLLAQTVLDFKTFKGQQDETSGWNNKIVKKRTRYNSTASVNGSGAVDVAIRFSEMDFSSPGDRKNLECLTKIPGLANQVSSVKLKLSSSVRNDSGFFDVTSPKEVKGCSFFNK
jgi:hypothetical protein